MDLPPSPHFTPVDLSGVWNTDRGALNDGLEPPLILADAHGSLAFRGIPFVLGPESGDDVVLLDEAPVTIAMSTKACYLLFLHVAEDRPSVYLPGFADDDVDGNDLGDHLADYEIRYRDGDRHVQPILRRFAVQQARIKWGASAFAAVPAHDNAVIPAVNESIDLGRVANIGPGRAETRTSSGRDRALGSGQAWIYALPVPRPDEVIEAVTLSSRGGRIAVYGMSATELTDHPLRGYPRSKLQLRLPDGVELNAIGELDTVGIDLGSVISARAVLDYGSIRRRVCTSEPVLTII